MITANQKKFVKSLVQKKFRKQHNCFLVEGVKMVDEALKSGFEVKELYATKAWIDDNPEVPAVHASNKELAQISAFKTPNEVVAVVTIPAFKDVVNHQGVNLAFDFIQDPGNLGTIIRTADWFGVKHIICSSDSVDCFNPKVVQASMGSVFRVNVSYVNLPAFFQEHTALKVYGAKLEGTSLKELALEKKGSVLLLGNESKGISSKLDQFITTSVSIDRIGQAESLNVASATSVLLYACCS